jgi:hypothetical protein
VMGSLLNLEDIDTVCGWSNAAPCAFNSKRDWSFWALYVPLQAIWLLIFSLFSSFREVIPNYNISPTGNSDSR